VDCFDFEDECGVVGRGLVGWVGVGREEERHEFGCQSKSVSGVG
jgi:hypothetical protein